MLYSQKGMATAPIKTAAGKNPPQGFVYLPLIAGWLFPGAGHFLLRKWGRGALLSVSIIGMFVLGLAMKGKIYTGAQDILEMLGGTKFIVVAGLLNVIAAVDAHNLRTGRKSE